MDVEATRAIRQAELRASQTVLDRTEKRFGIKPDWLAADIHHKQPGVRGEIEFILRLFNAAA
uniref:hypothetical protein n=1 Tax=Roseobacter weihaiensis TaxID=2763262 RepID=UPI001D0A02E3|nr:hypothetical protein [Roseobacter sp. H9]